MGFYLPAACLTNSDLERMVDTSDTWIRTRTGIESRRVSAPHETTLSLALPAAKAALEDAGISASDLDLILVCTVTPDMAFPATACLLQRELSAVRAAACDIEAACSGFIYGLTMAWQFVGTGFYQNILVVAADTLSKITNYSDRNTCVLFGDGAGAAVVSRDGRHRIEGALIGADGNGADLLSQPAGGSRQPATVASVLAHGHTIHMDGAGVFKQAVRVMGDISERLLGQLGLTPSDLNWFVPHQANRRIIDAAAQRLGMPDEKVIINIDHTGNMSGASIPVAIAEAQGRFAPGEKMLLAAFGAGFTYGAAVVTW